jgi:hypothetical protein
MAFLNQDTVDNIGTVKKEPQHWLQLRELKCSTATQGKNKGTGLGS